MRRDRHRKLIRRAVMAVAVLAIPLVCTERTATAQPVQTSDRLLIGFVDYVHDGDTIVVAGQPVRLNGIDAPELTDTGGGAARDAMIGIIGDHRLTCRLDGTRTHNRVVGVCFTEAGIDIGVRL